MAIVKENSFDGAPGGRAGVLGYGTTFGTPGGGNTVQDPNHFAASDTPTTGSQLPTSPDTVSPDRAMAGRKSSSGAVISPAANADKQDSLTPMNPEDAYNPQVDQLFKKKNTPNPDEIMSGLQYELNNMVKKDKTIAKQTVLKNLKTDPQYYSRLNMLNIDDEKMKVDESKATTFDKTKNVLDNMVSERQKQRQQMMSNPAMDDIFVQMRNKRYGYRK